MNAKAYRDVFSSIAQQHGFASQFGGWFFDTPICVFALDLQKSNNGNYYELNVKLFIQGAFGETYKRCADLVKKKTGDIFTRQPNEFRPAFDLDQIADEQTLRGQLTFLFESFIVPLAKQAQTIDGLLAIGVEKKAYLLPAVEAELMRLKNS